MIKIEYHLRFFFFSIKLFFIKFLYCRFLICLKSVSWVRVPPKGSISFWMNTKMSWADHNMPKYVSCIDKGFLSNMYAVYLNHSIKQNLVSFWWYHPKFHLTNIFCFFLQPRCFLITYFCSPRPNFYLWCVSHLLHRKLKNCSHFWTLTKSLEKS